MKLYQAIAVFIVLLHVGSCALHCSASYNDRVRCKQIINVYEKALLEQDASIFTLNDLFYPSNESPIDSILVGYIVNTKSLGNLSKFRTRGWCKTNVYTIVSPLMLETLFTGLVYFYNSKVSRRTAVRNKIIADDYKLLYLNLTYYNELIDTEEELNYALNYITPWLKLYASKEFQLGKTSYNDDDKGYMCDVFSFNWYWMIISVLATITVMCVASRILYWLLDTKSKQVEKNITVFSGFISLVSLLNTIEIILMALQVKTFVELNVKRSTYYNPSAQQSINLEAQTATKILQIIFSLLVFVVGGIIGQVCSKSLPKPPDYIVSWLIIPSYVWRKCKCPYFPLFGNFFCFAFLIGQNVLPTLIMLFITPIETISTVIYLIAIVTSLVMWTIFIIRKAYSKRRETTIRKLCTGVDLTSAIAFYLVILTAFSLMFMFLAVLATVHTANTSYLAPVFLSAASITLPVLIKFVTDRKMSSKEAAQNNDEVVMESGMEVDRTSTNENNTIAINGVDMTPLMQASNL